MSCVSLPAAAYGRAPSPRSDSPRALPPCAADYSFAPPWPSRKKLFSIRYMPRAPTITRTPPRQLRDDPEATTPRQPRSFRSRSPSPGLRDLAAEASLATAGAPAATCATVSASLRLNLAGSAVLRQVVEQVPVVPKLSLPKATSAMPLNIALGAAQPHLIDVNDAFCGTGHPATVGRQTRARRHYQDCGTGRAHDPVQAESGSLQHAPTHHHPDAARTNSETPPQKQKDALSQQHSKGNPDSRAPGRPPHTSPHLKPCPLESRVQFFHHVCSSLGRAAGVRR